MSAKKKVKKAVPSSEKKAVKKIAPLKKTAKANLSKQIAYAEYPKVEVDYASECTQQWVNFNYWMKNQYNLNLDFIRAFFIPKEDIEAMHEMFRLDSNINGCRVYLGMDPFTSTIVPPPPAPPLDPMKLFMVAVLNGPSQPEEISPPGTDILYSPVNGKSLVYDFSCPCPSTCDIQSELYHADASPIHKQNRKAKKVDI